MPMQLLKRLCGAQLPMAFDGDEDIAKCSVLRAAKLIEADLPPVLYELRRVMHSGPATVLRVTASGESATGRRTWPPAIRSDCIQLQHSASQLGGGPAMASSRSAARANPANWLSS
jgi:hypothetical protein